MFRHIVFAIASFLFANFAFAIADGSSGCWKHETRYISMHGTPEQLGAEIDKMAAAWYDQAAKRASQGLLSRIWNKRIPTKPSTENLRKVFANLWAGCPGRLLDYAVAAGNVPNAEMLIALGADPAGRSPSDGADDILARLLTENANQHRQGQTIQFDPDDNIFRRCIDVQSDGYLLSSRSYHKNDSLSMDQHSRSKLIKMLAKLTGPERIYGFDRFGKNSLSTCNDPLVLSVLTEIAPEAVARCPDSEYRTPCTTALDHRLMAYIHQSYGEDGLKRNLRSLEIVARAHPTKSLTRSVESSLCHVCRNGPGAAGKCSKLENIIQTRNSAVLLPRAEYKPDLDPISEATICFKLVE